MSAIDTGVGFTPPTRENPVVLPGYVGRPSILTCQAVNGICPEPSNCNEDYYYDEDTVSAPMMEESFIHNQAAPTGGIRK